MVLFMKCISGGSPRHVEKNSKSYDFRSLTLFDASPKNRCQTQLMMSVKKEDFADADKYQDKMLVVSITEIKEYRGNIEVNGDYRLATDDELIKAGLMDAPAKPQGTNSPAGVASK